MLRVLVAMLPVVVLYAAALALDSDPLLRAAGFAVVFAAFSTFFDERRSVDPAGVPHSADRARGVAGLRDAGSWLVAAVLLVAGAVALIGLERMPAAAFAVGGLVGIAIALVRDRRVALADPEVLAVHRRGDVLLLLSSLTAGFAFAALALAGVSSPALAGSLEALSAGVCALGLRGIRDARADPRPIAAQA